LYARDFCCFFFFFGLVFFCYFILFFKSFSLFAFSDFAVVFVGLRSRQQQQQEEQQQKATTTALPLVISKNANRYGIQYVK